MSQRMSRHLIWRVVLSFLILGALQVWHSPSLAQERGPWVLDNASGAGGRVVDTAIDPLDPNRQIIVTDLGGVLRTLDGGRTWERFNLGLADVNGFSNGANVVAAADPEVGQTLFYLSRTGERELVYTNLSDEEPRWEPVGSCGYRAGSIWVSPDNIRELYVGTRDGQVRRCTFDTVEKLWNMEVIVNSGGEAVYTAWCSDGDDSDGDGLTDCADLDCAGLPVCSEDCDDGIDNNLNSLVDCADPSCLGTAACAGPSVEDCTDGADDDGDGLADCDDADCIDTLACYSRPPSSPVIDLVVSRDPSSSHETIYFLHLEYGLGMVSWNGIGGDDAVDAWGLSREAFCPDWCSNACGADEHHLVSQRLPAPYPGTISQVPELLSWNDNFETPIYAGSGDHLILARAGDHDVVTFHAGGVALRNAGCIVPGEVDNDNWETAGLYSTGLFQFDLDPPGFPGGDEVTPLELPLVSHRLSAWNLPENQGLGVKMDQAVRSLPGELWLYDEPAPVACVAVPRMLDGLDLVVEPAPCAGQRCVPDSPQSVEKDLSFGWEQLAGTWYGTHGAAEITFSGIALNPRDPSGRSFFVSVRPADKARDMGGVYLYLPEGLMVAEEVEEGEEPVTGGCFADLLGLAPLQYRDCELDEDLYDRNPGDRQCVQRPAIDALLGQYPEVHRTAWTHEDSMFRAAERSMPDDALTGLNWLEVTDISGGLSSAGCAGDLAIAIHSDTWRSLIGCGNYEDLLQTEPGHRVERGPAFVAKRGRSTWYPFDETSPFSADRLNPPLPISRFEFRDPSTLWTLHEYDAAGSATSLPQARFSLLSVYDVFFPKMAVHDDGSPVEAWLLHRDNAAEALHRFHDPLLAATWADIEGELEPQRELWEVDHSLFTIRQHLADWKPHGRHMAEVSTAVGASTPRPRWSARSS